MKQFNNLFENITNDNIPSAQEFKKSTQEDPETAHLSLSDIDPESTDVSKAMVPQYTTSEGTSKNLIAWGYKMLWHSLYDAWDAKPKNAILIYGDPGVGKSDIVRDFGCNVAAENNRKPVLWETLTKEQKKHVLLNAKDYFVIVDKRANQMEPPDVTGLANVFNDKDYLEYKVPQWLYLCAVENAMGILFLDELNQGSEQTLKSLFSIVLDGYVGDIKITPNIMVVSAGNLGAEFGNTPIPIALENRFKGGILVANPTEWLEWAAKNGVPKVIRAFVEFDPVHNFYVKPTETGDKFPTPRSIMNFVRSYNSLRQKYFLAKKEGRPISNRSLIEAIIQNAAEWCGPTWANSFRAYYANYESFNIDKLHASSKEIMNNSKDKLSALVVYIQNQIVRLFKVDPQLTNPKNVELWDKILTIFAGLDKEYKVLFIQGLKKESLDTWNMIKEIVTKSPKGNKKLINDFIAFLHKDMLNVMTGGKSKKGA